MKFYFLLSYIAQSVHVGISGVNYKHKLQPLETWSDANTIYRLYIYRNAAV